MKKLLRSFCLIVAFGAIIQTQSVKADNYAAYLPGVASAATTNTTSFITVPGASLKTKITALPFTFEMSFLPTAYNTYGGLWCDRSGATVCNLQYGSGVNYLRLDYGGTASVLALTNAIPILNQWNHVALVISVDSIKLELNGTWYRMAKANTMVPFTGISYIGCDYLGVVNRTITGQFDNIRFWNTKRLEADIAANKNTKLLGTETGLVANYDFDGQNMNDLTPNAYTASQPATALTYTDLTTTADLLGIGLSAGVLTSDFSTATTTYSALIPPSAPSALVTAYPASYQATIGNNNTALSSTIPSVVLNVTSSDGLISKPYTVNYGTTTMADWSADGATGNRSYPNLWGWNCSDSPGAWGLANGANCRLLDITTGWFFNTPTAWTGRGMYIRWDGTGATTANSVFSYPVSVVAGTSYKFTYKYAWANNATQPTLTYGFATDKNGLNMVAADTAMTSIVKQNLKSKSFTFTAATSGVYYLTIKSSTAALCAIADLTLAVDNSTQNITSSVNSLSFDNFNQTKTFIIGGANLTSDITLTPPTGVTLSKTTVTMAEALTGATITATYNNSTNILGGILTYANGTISKSIAINGSADGSCFTQLYPGLVNLITDPYLNSLSTYGGWGTKSIVADPNNAFCGLNCALVGNATAKNTGSMDFYPPAGVMMAKTTYRLHAMVKTVGAGLSMQFGFAGCGIGGVTTDFTSLVTTNGVWAPFDLTFTTGTLAGTQDIYFNNSNATTPAFSGYIDNYELYAIPAIYAPATLSFLGAGSQTMVVRGVSFSDNITITAPTGYTVTPSTFAPSSTGTTVTVTFNSATSASGNLSLTNAAGTLTQSVAVTGTVAPTMVANPTSLILDDINATGSFTVTGGNLVSDIAITAPTGITVNPTTILKGSANGVTVAVTYDKSTSNVSGNITLTSGTLVSNVAVTATKNSDCFSPLYSSLTNLIPNPSMNDISAFGGWGTGTRAVVLGQAYCGAACVMFNATTNAYPTGDDMDLTNIVWAANSTYRLHAWVKAVDGTFAFLANGTNPDVTISVPQSNNSWELIDQTFKTGAVPATGFFTFNNLDGASTGKIAYLDNYELYNITSVLTNVDNSFENQNQKVYIQDNKIVAYVNLAQASAVEFSVYNMQGMLLAKQTATFGAGNNHTTINSNLPSGIYLVKMFSKAQSFTTKVIK